MSAILHHGPAADVLATFAPASVDMVYMDPPFGNGKVWTGKAGTFDDRWAGIASDAGWAALRAHTLIGCRAVEIGINGGSPHARGYIGAMAGILVAAWRALKPTGTLWLHHDDTMAAYLRVLGDMVFGPRDALGTVVWKRTSSHNMKRLRCYGRNHDTITVWGRTRVARYRLWRTGSDLVQGDPIGGGHFRVDGFCDDQLNARSAERVDYPTQKPVALVSRFIAAATVPGDLVLDPTCGSGTTLVAAPALGRRAVGIDASADAITAARARLPKPAPPKPVERVPARPQPVQLNLFGKAA